MRIVLVSEAFFPAVDDTTTTVKAVADRLIDAGHELLLVAPVPGLGSYRGCQVARISPDGLSTRVRIAIERFRPDLVHVSSPGRLGRKALKHSRRMAVPSLVVQHTPVSSVAADYWRSKVAARADRVLVTSSWMVGHLAELGVPALLWAPGVDTRAYAPQLRVGRLHAACARSLDSDRPLVVVGYAGGLHKHHGVRRLSEIAHLPGIRLVVIGDGPQRGWLEDRLPTARFTGPLEPDELAAAIASLDVFVHPGERETCCHMLRAAAASGVPVVAPRAGGAPDVVRSLENGLLYDTAEPSALRHALTAVVADRHRGLLGRRGRELAVQRSWASAVDELVRDHYLQLIVQPTGRSAA